MSAETIHKLLLTDQNLVIAPCPSELESWLTYEHKSMDEGRESTLTELKLGTRTPDGQALVTYQGLHRRVAAWFTERGLRYELKRHSSFKAVPKLDRMHGFRFSQKELLTKFLLQNMSGCFEAPTRYGKCFDPATPVMMADGSSRRVDAI